MNHFFYKHGVLHAEKVSVLDLARAVKTPFYCYSSATLQRHYAVFSDAFLGCPHQICYSVKANSNQAVLKTLADLGAGMDVVSQGELRRALLVGVPGERIVFSGVGKTREEMAFALSSGIFCFNVESHNELMALDSVARELGRVAPVALRVNPDVDAQTHEKITTGRLDNKFGIPFRQASALYDEMAALSHLRPIGVDVHIGSQLTDLAPFEKAYRALSEWVVHLKRRGLGITHADLGGGLGIPYHAEGPEPPSPSAYAEMVKKIFKESGLKLLFEPGRMMVGNAGILVTQVLYVKETESKRFLIVDAAMNDLLRPTLYEAWHEIIPVRGAPSDGERRVTDVVGPICESGDFFAKNRTLPIVQEGDLLAVLTAGAYGAVLSNTYNTRLLIPEILVQDHEFALVRPPMTYDDLIGRDRLAPWQ